MNGVGVKRVTEPENTSAYWIYSLRNHCLILPLDLIIKLKILSSGWLHASSGVVSWNLSVVTT